MSTHLNVIRVVTHHRWQDHLPIGIRQGRSNATAQGSHKRICGTQVYSDSQAPLMRLWALSGLSNLK
ncbi:hypothetical protein PsSCT_43350 [Pseudomonas sp. SCT]